MKHTLQIQNACGAPIPAAAKFRRWAAATLATRRKHTELSLRIVSEAESAELNERYRHKQGATNVLSFPCASTPGVDLPILGDLAICAAVVQREAAEQRKSTEAHWAHMVVHGTLHLLGYDHLEEKEAERMEALEIEILADLGYPDPYQNPEGKAA